VMGGTGESILVQRCGRMPVLRYRGRQLTETLILGVNLPITISLARLVVVSGRQRAAGTPTK